MRTTAITPRRPGDYRRRVRRAAARADRSRDGASGAAHAGFADAARRRGALGALRAVRARAPMLSLANAFDAEELRAFDERVRKLAASPIVATCANSRSTASRSRSTTRRRVRARRNARRRPRRRRGHAEPAHDHYDSAAPARSPKGSSRAGVPRSARRSVSAQERFRRSSTRGANAQACRCSPTRATPHRAACASSIPR